MKNTKSYLSIILTLVFVAMLCACGSSEGGSGGSIFSSKTTIDAKDYISINFGKYDGYAVPEIQVDFEAMSEKIDVETFNNFKNSFTGELRWELDMYDNRADVFDIDFSENYENLSNGDKVIVKITIEPYLESEGLTLKKLCDGLGIKFKDTEIKYTVSGLEEPENVIDIFGDIENYIGFNGTNGNGETGGYGERRATDFLRPVSSNNAVYFPDDYSRQVGELFFVCDGGSRLNVLLDNIKICSISYSCYGTALKKGDKIEIEARFDASNFEEHGYFVANDTKTITVPDLGEYITTKEQLTNNVIEQLKTQLEEDSGKQVIELYCVTLKPHVEQTHHSKACLVSVVKSSDWLGTRYHYYYAYDIILEPDGSVISKWDRAFYKKTVDAVREAFYTDSYTYELVKSFDIGE